MNEFLLSLPEWAQSAIAWISTGTNLASLAGIIAALFKIGNVKKENQSVTTTQIGLLQVMVDKLSDTRELASQVQDVSKQMSEALTCFEAAIETQRQSNMALASFVMECFNRSNLSDESKAELKIIADKVFYNDNTAIIESLKQAKAAADAALTEGLAQIARLEEELALERQKLAKSQENIKANRRV